MATPLGTAKAQRQKRTAYVVMSKERGIESSCSTLQRATSLVRWLESHGVTVWVEKWVEKA